MAAESQTGWEELRALQSLASGAHLEIARRPLDDLIAALDLGGYKFCVASAEPDGYRVAAVIAGGDLHAAPESFLGVKIDASDPILWEATEAQPR